jgi:protein-S-isoprenylcysteine O-methyltransferase Ste14
MLIGFFQAFVVTSAALVFYGIDRVFTQRFDRERVHGGTATTWRYMLQSTVLACVLIVQPLFWPQLGLRIVGPAGFWLQLAGVALALAAAALNAWARQCLGVFYAQRAELQQAHRVIRHGPYAYVRHPIYSAYILVAVALLLVLPSLPMLLVCLYSYRLFHQTAQRDESFLCAELPGYTDYMQRTPRFLPFGGRARA